MHRRVLLAVAWLLVALWLPATLHCAAEAVGWLEELACCGGEANVPVDDHQTLDHCETLSDGVVREDLAPAVVIVPPLEVFLAALSEVLCVEQAASNAVSPRSAAPPEIGGLWRVVTRVVAIAQAP